jgi:integrase/recombinase XerD
VPQSPVKTRKQPVQLDQVRHDLGLHTTWDDAVEAFLKEKRRMNRSPSTLELYRTLLTGKRTRDFLNDAKITTAAGLTEQALKDFESQLQAAGLSPGSVHQFHATIKNFARFCLERGMAEDRGVLDVSAPKRSKRAPGIISPADETKLLAAARTPRDRFIVQFLIGTGLRRAELLKLTLDDIAPSADGFYVHVHLGKGGKDRKVPLDSAKMGTNLTKAYRDYLRHGRPQNAAQTALLLTSRKGNGSDYQPLDTAGLRSMLRRLEQDTGVECNPHRFRHTYGTRMIQAGVQPFAVQRLLGHTTLDMVSIYVHYDTTSLFDSVN